MKALFDDEFVGLIDEGVDDVDEIDGELVGVCVRLEIALVGIVVSELNGEEVDVIVIWEIVEGDFMDF